MNPASRHIFRKNSWTTHGWFVTNPCIYMPSFLSVGKRLLVLGLLLTSAAFAGAQNAFSPGGNDYPIAGALGGDQTAPQAAVNASGGWLVWQDNAVDGDGLGIKAQRLSANLTQAAAGFRVNGQGAGDQEKPQVALLNTGGAVFVWQGGPFGFQKIYARFLAANGAFITGDILVNTYTSQHQINPAVATLADGSVVVVWSSFDQDGFLMGVYGQRFDATGQKLGAEFQINQFARNNQRTPAVAALANGNFVVVWISELQRASASVDVYARLYDSAGTAVGNEFAVNTSTTNLCANPQVAGSPQGGFAVVWSQKEGAVRNVSGIVVNASTSRPNSWDVYGRLYNANGTAANAPVRLNTEVFGDQYGPKINSFGKNYLVVWSSLGQDSSREGVFGQFLNSDGSLEGVEFRVNTTAVSRQLHPAVAADGINRFLVVWTSFVAGTSFDLFARAYDIIRAEMVHNAQAMSLTWNTQPGLVYQPQTSTDFVHWTDLGPRRTANGLSDSLPVNASNGAAYYRVVRAP